MTLKPKFPTSLHSESADLTWKFFRQFPMVDTILVVNSCARGQAVPESDLDFAILVKPGTTQVGITEIELLWEKFSESQNTILQYKRSSTFAHLHLDIIDGNYKATILEPGLASDFFEIEIGNQICYSAPMGEAGNYFNELRGLWLPYYNEDLRQQRFLMTKKACQYDLDHIPLLVKRGLHFQAFDSLWKAFREYLQVLFIARKTYPIAYNKWIKEQIINWLMEPKLYQKLLPILTISQIESDEINAKAEMLQELLDDLKIN